MIASHTTCSETGNASAAHPEPRTPNPEPRREAFTLLELIVVVAIISLLISLLVYAVRGGLDGAKRAATIATIQKVKNDLDERRKALDTHIQSLGTQVDKYTVQNSLYKTAGYNLRLARVLVMKDFTRSTFPQRYSEIGITTDTGTANEKTAAESAEILYYAFTGEDIPNSGTPPVSIRIPGYTASGRGGLSNTEVGDTDGDKRLEILDGWGRPFRFYRWPTRLIRPGGDSGSIVTTSASVLCRALPSNEDLNRDQDDPEGLTQMSTWSYGSSFEADFHTRSTWHTLLVVSPGPDGVLGLYEPTDTTSTNGRLAAAKPLAADGSPNAALLDDITNLNIKAGGN